MRTNSLSAWILAVRPYSLGNSVILVLVASAMAWTDGGFRPGPAALCLAFALLMQCTANLVNDLWDFLKGADRPDRLGPDRAFAKGYIDIIGDTLFEISMGLETSNDYTRLKKINKGFTLDDFNKAVSLIQKLNSKKGYNLKSKAYIFVKPILLNEKEAIDEAIETARYCADHNVDRVSFCPATIHGGTLIERMWRKGAYQPPWIWSCIEIINTVRKELNIPALLDTSGFGSRRGPYNCKKCNKDLKHMIIANNLTQTPIDYDCDCKNKWLAEVNNADMNKSAVPVKHLPLY